MQKNKIVTIQLIDAAIEHLGDVANEMLFVGGSIVPLLFTSNDNYFRATKDVDCVINVEALVDYYIFTDKLKQIGFKEVSEDGAPICRWHKDDLVIDVMPTANIMGFTNTWYAPAFKHPITYSAGNGVTVNVISPVYFIATKLEAFNNRGNNDFIGSHDMEDIISIIECRSSIVDEILGAEHDVKEFIVKQFRIFCQHSRFLNDVVGHCIPDSIDIHNIDNVRKRILNINHIEF